MVAIALRARRTGQRAVAEHADDCRPRHRPDGGRGPGRQCVDHQHRAPARSREATSGRRRVARRSPRYRLIGHLHGHRWRRPASRPRTCPRSTLRAGETATVRVKLVGERRPERGDGVRHDAGRARRRADRAPPRQRDDRRDADPRPQGQLGAAAQLGVPLGQGHRRSLRQRHVFRHRRRQPADDDVHDRRREQRRGLGTPDHDVDGTARRRSGNDDAVECVLRRVRLDRRSRREHRHQVGHECRRTAKDCYMGRPADWQAKTFSTDRLLRAVGRDLRDADDAHGHQPGGRSRHAEPVLRIDRRARSSRTRRSSSRRATTRGRIGRRSSRPPCRRSCCRRTATSRTRATTGRGSSTDGWTTRSRPARR